MMVRRTLALMPLAVIAAACSDTPTAPRVAEQPGFYANAVEMLAAKRAGPKAALTTGSESFMVDPRSSRIYTFGDNWVYFPANSICDPATSGYGPEYWDAPCEPLTKPIRVTATWTPKGGHGFVEFEPALRFAPSSEWWRWVIVSITDRKMVDLMSSYSILYQVGDDVFVDESLADPTLRAYIDYERNTVYRRLKHFSGYMIQAGKTADGVLDAAF